MCVPAAISSTGHENEGAISVIDPIPFLLCIQKWAVVLEGESDRGIGTRNGTEHALEFLQRDDIFVVTRHRDGKVCHDPAGILRAYNLSVHMEQILKV